MKTQKYIFLLRNIVLGLLALTSCGVPATTATPQPVTTLSPTLLLLPGLTPTPSQTPIPMPPTPTFVPTLHPDQEKRVDELLRNEDCKLPCYLGIMPGKTTLSEARAILENLGFGYRGEYKRKDDSIEYPYILVISGRSEADETPRPDGSIVTVSQSISLITDNDVVQIIEVNVGTIGPGTSTAQARKKLREYWARYTARGIFVQLGLPDQLYTDAPNEIGSGSNLWATYNKIGVVAQIYGTGQENNICPQLEATWIDLRLLLSSATSQLSIFGDGGVPPTDRNVWLPIEEVLGVSTQEFYQGVIADPSACFVPKTPSP